MPTRQPDFQLFSTLRFDVLLLESSANPTLSTSPSPFYMLPYHRDRMLEAAAHFGWSVAAERIRGPEGLQHLLRQLEAATDTKFIPPLRVRTVLHHDGDITVETNETPAVPLVNLFPSRIPPPAPKLEVSPLTGGAMMLGGGDSLQSGTARGNPVQTQPWTVVVDPEKTTPSEFTIYKTTYRDMYIGARARAGIESMTDCKEVLIVSDTGSEIMEGSLTSVLFWRGGRWVTPPVSSGGQAGTTRRWLLENGLCDEEVVSRDSLVDGEECWISNGVRGLIWGKVKL
jgi:4-amino-4-deoxychorismate lyase